MKYDTLGDQVTAAFVLKGPSARPLLAPRGVCIAGDRVLVSDTGQNRVLVWQKVSNVEYLDPDVILGQTDIPQFGRNARGKVAANTLYYPSGLWSDGKKIVVADAWNHRVLIWHAFPSRNGQPADVVVGQPGFGHNLPNVQGLNSAPSVRSLHWPYGVFYDGIRLWIADTGNRRVLLYNEMPKNNFTSADCVIGQSNFESKDLKNENPVWPYSVRVGEAGQLAIADTQSYRTLVWHHWQDAFSRQASIIIGQPDFNSIGQNQFGLSPASNTLSWTYDACFYKKGIFVNDTGNSRILWFSEIPTQHNASARNVLGRPDFTTGSEYKETLMGTQNALYWPFSMAVFDHRIAIADTGNHRLILGKLTF